MTKKLFSFAMSIILLFSLALAGCGQKQTKVEQKKDEMKVGFIYVGPIGDGGWSFSHNEGRLYLEKQLGVKTTYKESVPEGPECEKVIKDMIDEGCKVIFTTSYGFMDPTEKVAKEYPDVKFFHCSGYKQLDNMSNYFGRMYQARYLSGIVAGMKTKSNKIGYVAAYEIPEVIRGINAFTLGVQSVNPKAKVFVRWTHTWYDPAKEKDAAKSLLEEEKVDVISQHQDTNGPSLAAEEKGAFAIGYNTDSREIAKKAYLTSPIWNWGPYYVKAVKSVMDKTFKSESYWGPMNDGVVKLAPLTDLVAPGTKEKVDEATKKILDGNLYIFEGPIKDQTGKIKVANGVKMTDKEMLSFDWFVEGVVGKIEK